MGRIPDQERGGLLFLAHITRSIKEREAMVNQIIANLPDANTGTVLRDPQVPARMLVISPSTTSNGWRVTFAWPDGFTTDTGFNDRREAITHTVCVFHATEVCIADFNARVESDEFQVSYER